MNKINFLFFIVLLLFCSCQHIKVQVPEGKYVAKTKKEYIIVKPSRMFFHLKVIGKPNIFIEREYKYDLWEDGTIIPLGLASGEYYLGVGQYDLFWDGRNIIVKEIKTKNVIRLKKTLI